MHIIKNLDLLYQKTGNSDYWRTRLGMFFFRLKIWHNLLAINITIRGSYSDMFIRDTINWVDRSSPLSSPVFKHKVLAPTQGDSSVREYIKMIKLYASATGLDLQSEKLKKAFFDGLSLDNKKRAIRFGTDEPLDELVEYLVKVTSSNPLRGHPWELEQGNDSIEDFYEKHKKYAKLSRWDERECKYQFIRGLSSANQLEARLCGLDLPLGELVDRLVKLEALERRSG
jgi:hypothetical protein